MEQVLNADLTRRCYAHRNEQDLREGTAVRQGVRRGRRRPPCRSARPPARTMPGGAALAATGWHTARWAL